MTLDYFYGQAGELFSFFRIPKALFQEQRFQNLSTDAKILYGILLDRMSLSARNGWLDKAGRVFIIYTVQEVQDSLGCADKKATKLLRELEEYGLIERKRRGLGKPDLIYVKNFSSESSKTPYLNRDNDDSGTVQNTLQDPAKLRCNKTERNNTEISDTDPMSLALSALLIAFEHSYNLLKELKLATSNLEQAFDTKPLSYKEEKVKLSHFDITFENVDFSYNQQADVLHNISFHAPEGSTTALIGPSGSGKSTVANLIARFWDVTKGCVRIGGQDIRELNPDGLLHYISEVFQENTLLSDTIYNNIKAGREDATEQEVIAAAKAAHCHEFIERLPNGYQTHLAEGGNTLSGGEKQRIAIARAILKDAPILLLDESTASLDADNEAKINQALDRLMKGKTVFVIAHRLNTIQNADQIIVLNQGRIEETGTHEELLRKKGHYYEMVQEQQKAREWIVKGA